MNRNAESHFAIAPSSLDISRSQFDRSHGNTFTTNFGKLTPCYIEEVLPGDTFNVTTAKVVRLQTLLKPIFGNMYLDTYYFFVPNRLVWEHWQEFCGESHDAWTPRVEYEVPKIRIPNGGFAFGSLADYLGVPPGVGDGELISALPFRAYTKIVNDWFRNQNLEDEFNLYVGDATVDGDSFRDGDMTLGGACYTAGKYHDLFTSCLPQPQKGPTVTIPLGYGDLDAIPVKPFNVSFDTLPEDIPTRFNAISYGAGFLAVNHDRSKDSDGSIVNGESPLFEDASPLMFTNLGIATDDLSISVTDMRMSFQVQKYYEQLARGGSRYIEILKSMFNVTSPDARLQRAEYLGGNRMPLAVSQVTNNAQSESNPLGNLGAMSMTNDRNHDFIHSFVEHGYIIGVCVARYEHSYPQGLPKHFSRFNKFDFYWPVFANISEQPIFKRELYFGGNDSNEVFGYQEPWAHYRFGFNACAGEMRPDHPTSLASWNLADDYNAAPSLSYTWAEEDKTNVDRTLAVTSAVSDQILIDMWFNNVATRPMPMFSVPGLIDHH